MFTDTHCHLYQEYYLDINETIKEAIENDVNRYFVVGCDTKSNQEVIDVINKYDNTYGIIGIHPEYAENYKDEDIEFIKNSITKNKVIAIGEIGLDYHYSKDLKNEQKELFEKQLKIAEDNNIPVVIHSREATQDTIDILKKYHVKGIIHAFSGSLETANIYIKMGFKLGVGGVITFKNSNLKDVIKQIPINNIVLETDAPYLTPHPYRGSQNAPKYIKIIAEFLAELYDIPLSQVAKVTNQNIREIFDL